jgi:nucleotide-binding universal stress UspA family protein
MLPKIQTIIYSTDLGPGASYVFRYALALARQHEAKIIAVHVLEPLSSFGKLLVEQYVIRESTVARHEKALEDAKVHFKKRLEDLCARECNKVAACETAVESIHVVDGEPDEVILNFAREYNADLIIMGAHSHSVVGGVLMGATARKVLHNATQPVLLVNIPKELTEVS